MKWNELFNKDNQPTMEDVAKYFGSFKSNWINLLDFFESAYKCRPKLTYSGCGMKSGWNIKFQKGSAAFGTWYPQPNAFDVMFTWSYTLNLGMLALPYLTSYIKDKVIKADDFMKNGRWIMFHADSVKIVNDYKMMCEVKRPVEKINVK